MALLRRLLQLLFLFYLLVSALCSSSNMINMGLKKKKQHEIKGPIKTVVVLVMENRSFDHMLGWLNLTGVDGFTGAEFNHLNTSDPSSRKVFVSSDASFIDSDPGHSYQAIREQIFGSNDSSSSNFRPTMSGFAQQALSMGTHMPRTVMSGFPSAAVPVFDSLAREFAVFDRWFASVPSSTQPNRLYVHSATSHGAFSNVRKDLINGFPQKTIFDSLDDAGLSFGVYDQNIPAVLFFRSLRKLKFITRFHNYKHAFKRHARLGRLPNSVTDPEILCRGVEIQLPRTLR